MHFWNKICGFFLLFIFCALPVLAQNSLQLNTGSYLQKLKLQNPGNKDSFSFSVQITNARVYQPLPGSFYTQHFGFFCRKELQIEKSVKIPLRFRLGSLDQCNYLEGKRTGMSTR